MATKEPTITYDLDEGTAFFHGPGGFTEPLMEEDTARGIAKALNVPFKVESAVTPEGLRAAARAIIMDGADGTSAAARHSSRAWSRLLMTTFRSNREVLLALCTQYPPTPAAEIRLLEMCESSVGRDQRELIIAAKGL